MQTTPIKYRNNSTSSINLTLMPPSTAGVYSILAVVNEPKDDKTWQLAGRLDVLARTPKTYSVTLVPLLEDQDIDEGDVRTKLNNIWNQYGISWEVDVDNEFYVDVQGDDGAERKQYVNEILDGDWTKSDNWLSEYKPVQKAINSTYNTYASSQNTYDNTRMYVFVLPEDKAPYENQIGDMPLGKQWGYLFVNNFGSDEHYRTLSHELGHGKTELEHTFAGDNPAHRIEKGKTNNLMDYSNGTDLVRFQWEAIHNPAIIGKVFQSDEDGANYFPNKALVGRIIEKLRYYYVNSQRYILTTEEAGYTYCSNIELLDGNTYSYVQVANKHDNWSISPSIVEVNSANTFLNYVPQDVAGIPFSLKKGDFSLSISDDKKTSFVSYMKPSRTTWESQISSLKKSIYDESDNDLAIDLMNLLPDELYGTLSSDYRKKYIKTLSQSSMNESGPNQINEERMAVNLIGSTPDSQNQIESLINFFKTDRAMLDLCYRIDNLFGEDNYSSFTNKLLGLYLEKYSSELDVQTFSLPIDHLFYWRDKGLLDKITYDFEYERASNLFVFKWKYRTDYYTNPVKVAPFDIVAVNFETDISFLSLGEKRVVLMPAFVFAWLVNQDENLSTKDKIDVAIKLAEFALAFYQVKTIDALTGAALKLYFYMNEARTGANLILVSEELRADIESNVKGGKSFLDFYDVMNDAWEGVDFTVNWFKGNIEYFTAFTQSWDKMVEDNSDIDFTTQYPDLYNLITNTKKGLE